MTEVTATFVSRDVLDHVRSTAEMQGTSEIMAAKLAMIVEAFAMDAEPGDYVELHIEHALPVDHPLIGVRLG